jgi:hypothetical protein
VVKLRLNINHGYGFSLPASPLQICRRAEGTLYTRSQSEHSKPVRLISNAVFFTALALIILQPLLFPGLIHESVTIELPQKVSIH